MIRLALPSVFTNAGLAWARAPLARLASMTAFGLVGVSGVAVNQLLLWALVDVTGMNYLAAAALASGGSTTTNFLLNDFVVFRAQPARGLVVRYLAFMALTVATMPIRLPILYLLTSGLHIHYLVSNPIALMATFAIRYLVSDSLIWSRPERLPQGGSGR